MVTGPFDPGPQGTFATLCQNYPDDTVYQGAFGFRSLWGPIFYRGRADGSARLLVIGQDPAQTEAVTRRILSGQAGRRVQGFVEKLGYSKSYLMINAFAYGIYKALHPTADKPGGPITRKDLLDNWNVALNSLHSQIQHPDVVTPLVPYGNDFTAAELPAIPNRDFPMGLPSWMRSTDFWATLATPPGTERANISVVVP